MTLRAAAGAASPSMVIAVTAIAALLASGFPRAQSSTNQSANQAGVASANLFTVASVKANVSGSVLSRAGYQPGGGFTATNVPLRELIVLAYGIQENQLVAVPAWASVERFDIAAKAAGAPAAGVPDPARGRSMLQALLKDRFQLRAHEETRELPVYSMVMERSDRRLGPALRVAAGGCTETPTQPAEQPPCGMSGGFAALNGRSTTMRELASSLSRQVGRTVIDRTDLTGTFDLQLRWTPDNLPPRPPGTPADQPIRANGVEIDPNGPSIFTALREQLLLRLENARGPVPVIVIDAVARPLPD
jgi:bla regulator protein blaR1